jgi:ribosomal protein S26
MCLSITKGNKTQNDSHKGNINTENLRLYSAHRTLADSDVSRAASAETAQDNIYSSYAIRQRQNNYCVQTSIFQG